MEGLRYLGSMDGEYLIGKCNQKSSVMLLSWEKQLRSYIVAVRTVPVQCSAVQCSVDSGVYMLVMTSSYTRHQVPHLPAWEGGPR